MQLTLQILNIIAQALEVFEQSQKRAKNSSRAPEFIPIYDSILHDVHTAKEIIRAEQRKAHEHSDKQSQPPKQK